MKRMMNWLLINSVTAYVLVQALYNSNEMARNVIMFLIWVNFLMMAIIANNKDLMKKTKIKGLPVSENIIGVYYFLFAVALAAYGWFFYAALEIVVLCLIMHVYDKEKK